MSVDDDSSSYDDSDSDDYLMSSTTIPASDGGAMTNRNDGSMSHSANTNNNNMTDREALVRKKLLENFYGKSVVNDGMTGTTDMDGGAATIASHSHRSSGIRSKNNRSKINDDNVDDIDSKAFDISKFVTQHLQSSSVQTLLEVEEQLSLQVRTYDSTMQTLVYENYTKFIDVTNAIKSIGTTVTTTNEEQIEQLITNTNAIYRTSRMMILDEVGDIGTIRQQVVEKKRIQRLLQRLHTLFVLPQTIRQCIQEQQYTTAITKYNHASMILAKYNTSNSNITNDTSSTTKLESFSSITTECMILLQQLYVQLQNQFHYWSGRSLDFVSSTNNTMRNEENDNDLEKENDDENKNDDNKDAPQELPKSMIEIYESVRALSMLHELFQGHNSGRSSNSNFIQEELYSMSFSAATRLLDRLLDAHSIQVQEYKFMMMNHPHNTRTTTSALDDYNDQSSNHNSTGSLLGVIQEHNSDGTTTLDEKNRNYLIPENILVAILECATLYQNSFHHNTDQDWLSERNYYLMEFITESYTSFMTHVRSILLQEDSSGGGGNQSVPNSSSENDDAMLESDHEPHPQSDISPEEISLALTVLVQYVQLFTNRLVDEVHLNVDYTNHLMQQAIDLASSLVHRRVDNQFRLLRYSIVNDGLLPFTNRIVTERERIINERRSSSSGDDGSILNNVLPEIIQIASSTLSDCLQLIDDAIRSIVLDSTPSTTENIDGSNNSSVGMVPSDVQDAVQISTYRLVSWLANTFEILVGGDPTDLNHIAQSQKPSYDENGTESGNVANKAVVYESIGDACEDELLALLYTARENIYQGCGGTIHSDILLSIIELCRLSETMVPQQIEQSMHFGAGKKKSSQRDLFPSSHDGTKTASTNSITRKDGNNSCNTQISKRFQVAGSRIFAILIMNNAFEATYRLLSTTNAESDGRRPSDNVLAVVQYAKTLSLQCATLFGGTKRAGPVPIWDDTNFNSGTMNLLSNRKSGLYLDVERMFKEKVTIYPHPSDILEYSRDAAMFLYFKIVISSWYENIREYTTATFSSNEYMQVQIDTIFIKYIIPHYLSNDYQDRNSNNASTNGRAALTTLMHDVLEAVEDRHHRQNTDSNTYGRNNEDEEIQRKARNLVRSFMVSVESDATSLAETFIIQES